MLFGQVLGALEQQPTGFFEHGLVALGLEGLHLLGADFIDRFAQVRHDVEAVEDMDSVGGFFGDHLEIGLPHVAADERKSGATLCSEPAKEAQEGFDLAVFAHPEQAFAVFVNLVDHGQVLVAALPLNLVDADGADTLQVQTRSSPGQRHRYGAKNRIPRRVERSRDLGPAQALGPRGKEPRIRIGDSPFACDPRQRFDTNPTDGTGHAAQGIEEKDRNAPHGNKLEAASGQAVVAWPRTLATGALWAPVGPVPDLDIETRSPVDFAPTRSPVDERVVLLDTIQDSLELHPAFLLQDVRCA